MTPKISVCIACHNQAHLLREAIESCLLQLHEDIEIIVLMDACTDNTKQVCDELGTNLVRNYEQLPYTKGWPTPTLKYYSSETPSGTGGSFNKAMSYATGDIIVLLCADDVFTDAHVLPDIAKEFKNPNVVHVTRYYHQFIDGDRRPVRAWRGNQIIELANNPSGLAFRKSAIGKCELSNKMFIEASSLVFCVMVRNPKGIAVIIPWDTIAVRIHQSTARSKDYYRKRWVSSPIEEWSKVGGRALQNDYTSLIQIKNYFTTGAVFTECLNFLRLRPISILDIRFWFFAAISLLTPRFLLMRLPHWYRITIGRWTTREVKRT